MTNFSSNSASSGMRCETSIPHLREAAEDVESRKSIVLRCAAAIAIILVSNSPSVAELPLDHSPDFVASPSSHGRASTWLDSFQTFETTRQIRAVSADGDSAVDDSEFDLSDFTDSPDENEHLSGRVRLTAERSPFDDAEEDEFSDSVDSTLHDELARPQTEARTICAEKVFSEGPTECDPGLCWQVLPRGLLYRTYMAGPKESRMQFLHLKDTKNNRTVWDATLGGRLGILRHGTTGVNDPQGFQLDFEGAVFARVLPEQPSAMLEGSDYRVGLYGTWREDRVSYRAGYYHISSHLGDEFVLANPGFQRRNYVRDSLLAGTSYDLTDAARVYGEVGYALGIQGGAEPLELQIGTEYTPVNRSSRMGAPFAGINGHFRQDFDFEGGMNIVSGWCWQGIETRHQLKVGLNYYTGPSLQYVFFDRWENLVGGGIWIDY